jgi:hypothetical protein
MDKQQLREKIDNQYEIKGENITEDQKMKDKIVPISTTF